MSLVDPLHKSGETTTISSSFPAESKICLQGASPIGMGPLTAMAVLTHSRLSGRRAQIVDVSAPTINVSPKTFVKKISAETLKEPINHLFSMLSAFQEHANQFKQEIPIKKASHKAIETRAERLTLAYQHPLYKGVRSATWQEKYVMDSESEPVFEGKTPPPSPIPLGKGFTGECLENLKTRIQNILAEAAVLRSDHTKAMHEIALNQTEHDPNPAASEWHECALLLNHIIEQGNITLNSLEVIPELNMLIFYLQEFFHAIRSLRKFVDDRDQHAEKLPKVEAIFTNISKMYSEDIKQAYLKADATFKALRPRLTDLTPEMLKLASPTNNSDIGLRASVTDLRTKLIGSLDNDQAELANKWTQPSRLYEQCLEELDMMGQVLKRFSKFDHPAFSVAYTLIRRNYWLEPPASKLILLHRLTNSVKPPYTI